MCFRNTTSSYGHLAKFLHWAIFFMVSTMYILVYFAPLFDKPIARNLIGWHKTLGILILFLMLFRVFWTLTNPKPAYPSSMSRLQSALSHSVQGLLYLSLIAMPLIGWAMSTASGHIPIFFGIQLPLLGIPYSKALGDTLFEAHEFMGWVIFVLIGLHAAAAFAHKLFSKDGVYERMLP